MSYTITTTICWVFKNFTYVISFNSYKRFYKIGIYLYFMDEETKKYWKVKLHA